MLLSINDLWKHRQAIRTQFYVDIKTTVATTRLGVLWWVLDPLLLMMIYFFVVKVVFSRGGPNYHLFALCGIVTWQSFARSINLCTSSLIRNGNLIKQANVPMLLYVIVSPLVQAFFYLIGLLIIIVWNNQAFGIHTLGLFFIIFLMVIMSFSIGLFLSVLEVYFRDTGKFVTYILRFAFYLSPILYSPDRIYDLSISWKLKALYSLNPMVHLMPAARDILLYGKMFDYKPILIMFVVAMCVMQLGLLYFRKISPYIPKMI